MPTLSAEYRDCLESANDRPADVAPTAEQRQRWAANRAAQVEVALARHAAKRLASPDAAPHNFKFILASENETVEFRPDADGLSITIVRKSFLDSSSGMTTLSLARARQHWTALIQAGFWRW